MTSPRRQRPPAAGAWPCRSASVPHGGCSVDACLPPSRSRSARSCWSTSTVGATSTETTRPAGVDLIDSIYYTTVTLSTTGYGDITPVDERGG
ncbi:potassium channel family protein [Nocardioides sp. B-3]|uniref:potassium channel family protein n=1 Tax=Nocardioides sp. B-3 TaxID=2895565 RepID=UPI0021538895|nr:potassium channel family protein [Nocardioides sp. B-3]UUZ58809.1 potassium channel family protein [Nocardioides sp. B-3]